MTPINKPVYWAVASVLLLLWIGNAALLDALGHFAMSGVGFVIVGLAVLRVAKRRRTQAAS